MSSIKTVEKIEDREDLDLFRIILKDGSTIDLEATDEDEAKAKYKKHLEEVEKLRG